MTHPTPAPKKERPFLPRLKDGGFLGRLGETYQEAMIAVPLAASRK